MAQKAQAGASHRPRARPGSGRVTSSVAVGAAGGGGGAERAGTCMGEARVYTPLRAVATSAFDTERRAVGGQSP